MLTPVIVIAALVTGLIIGIIIAGLAARTRQLDEDERAGTAWRDLLALAQDCADPAHTARLMREAGHIWDRWTPDGMHLEVLDRARTAGGELTPTYAHRLVDAIATGRPVDLSGCWVPPDIRGRLRAILAGAADRTTTLPDRYAAGGPVTTTPPLTGEHRVIRPRSSDG